MIFVWPHVIGDGCSQEENLEGQAQSTPCPLEGQGGRGSREGVLSGRAQGFVYPVNEPDDDSDS
jgi:hypothetical protein